MSSVALPLSDRSAFRVLCDHVDGAGLSTDTLRNLLWEINAHPDLIGLPQVCHNLHKILEAIPVTWGTPLSDWGLDDWPTLVHWIAAHGDTLQAIIPECDFLLKPRHPRAHPMLGRGVSRYPFYAADTARVHLTKYWFCAHERKTKREHSQSEPNFVTTSCRWCHFGSSFHPKCRRVIFGNRLHF